LVHLAAVGRHPHERRDARRERTRFQDLFAIEQKLQAAAQDVDVPWVVLVLEDDGVEL
jgi:hypothetical protein